MKRIPKRIFVLASALALLFAIAAPASADIIVGSLDNNMVLSGIQIPAGTVLTVGQTYTFHGNSQNGESGGIIKTEVSIDGGLTWQVVAGATERFDVTVTPTAPGAITLISRAYTINKVEASYLPKTLPVVGGTVACPCTFWQPDQANKVTRQENDPNPVELGLRFRLDRDGLITGLYFYHPNSDGPFVGHLWSADGQQLAEASIDGANDVIHRITFAQPVPVRAGDTYVVSYFAPGGNYAQTVDYFTDPIDQAPFQTDADAGVYQYGGGFPTLSWESANYGVGPIFATS